MNKNIEKSIQLRMDFFKFKNKANEDTENKEGEIKVFNVENLMHRYGEEKMLRMFEKFRKENKNFSVRITKTISDFNLKMILNYNPIFVIINIENMLKIPIIEKSGSVVAFAGSCDEINQIINVATRPFIIALMMSSDFIGEGCLDWLTEKKIVSKNSLIILSYNSKLETELALSIKRFIEYYGDDNIAIEFNLFGKEEKQKFENLLLSLNISEVEIKKIIYFNIKNKLFLY